MHVHRDVSNEVDVVETTVPLVTDPVVPSAGYVAGRAEVVRSARSTTLSPAAIVAGLLAIAMIVFGAVAVARAGVDGAWDDPIVRVGPWEATAALGAASVVLGIGLLIAALSRSRSALLFMAIVTGIVSLVAIIEPSLGDSALDIDTGYVVFTLIGSALVALLALVVPSVHRSRVDVQRVV